MAFAITANFLLGTYQGSDSGGRPEPYPSPDRLYKACVAAAYNTFDFERQTDDRVLTDEQIKNALAWLEDNDESGSKTYCDSQLPHRGFDGHIRVGVHDGKPTSEAKEYIDARNSTLENLLSLFELSPVTVLFGGWDSTRSKNQLRIPSVLTGEMYGVLADQSDDDPAIHRAGARIDPVGASVSVAKKADREKIVGDSIDRIFQIISIFQKRTCFQRGNHDSKRITRAKHRSIE